MRSLAALGSVRRQTSRSLPHLQGSAGVSRLPRDVEWDRPGAHQEVVPTDHRIPWEATVSVLGQVSGRQPAHRLEVLGIRHRNIVQGRHRNLVVEDSTVLFLTRCHTRYQVGGDVKFIFRVETQSRNLVCNPFVSKDGKAEREYVHNLQCIRMTFLKYQTLLFANGGR